MRINTVYAEMEQNLEPIEFMEIPRNFCVFMQVHKVAVLVEVFYWVDKAQFLCRLDP